MSILIETPQQELHLLVGQLIFENTAMRHQVEALSKRVEELEAEKVQNEE